MFNSCFTSGSLDLCNSRFGEGVGLDLYSSGNLTIAEHFHQFAFGGDSGGDEGIHIEFLEAELLAEGLDGGNVHTFVSYTGRVAETELRETALDRHLTAFETDLVLVTGTGLGTFGTTGGSTALTGTLTTTDALAVMGSALCGLQIFKFHL